MRTGAVDLVFANESELHSLYQTADFDTALAALRNDVKLAVVTRSEKGCVVVSRASERGGAGRADRQARRCDRRRRPVRRGLPGRAGARPGPPHRGRLGALAAAEVIQHLGARPEDVAERPRGARTGSPYEGPSSGFGSRHAAAESHRRPGHAVRSRTARSSPAPPPIAPRSSIRAATSRASAAAIDQLKVTPEKISADARPLRSCGRRGRTCRGSRRFRSRGRDERDAFLLSALEKLRARASASSTCATSRRRAGWSKARPSSIGDLTFNVLHVPGHTPGHLVFVNAPSRFRAGRRHAVSGFGRPHRLSLWRPRPADRRHQERSSCRSATT